MGLFSFNYSKPGPGVNPDEPEKKGFFRFWEIIREKFSKLIGANTMYALLSIPYLIILYFIAPINAQWLESLFQGTIADTAQLEETLVMIDMILRCIFALSIFILWGSGPASAMYAYISRCFTRRDPVWIVSDGFDKFKENFKQSIIVVIVDILAIIFGTFAVSFYFNMLAQNGGVIWMLLSSLMVIMIVVYTWMHFYIYQIMVTFKCTIRQIYRNAALFAVGMLPINLFVTIINLAILIGLFMTGLQPLLIVLLDLIILAMFMRFLIEFTAARRIRKTLLDTPELSVPKHNETIGEDENN